MAGRTQMLVAFVASLLVCGALGSTELRSYPNTDGSYTVEYLQRGLYNSGTFDDSSMEILAYDSATSTIAVVDASKKSAGITLLKLTSDLDTLEKTTAGQISFLDGDAGSGVGVPNSIVFYNSVLVVAAEATVKTQPGFVLFYDLDGKLLANGKVELTCALPDNIVISKDGKRVYLACEGENPRQDDSDDEEGVESNGNPMNGTNPEGVIGVVSVEWDSADKFVSAANVKDISIKDYIDDDLSSEQYEKLKADGMIIDGRLEKPTAAKDMEPEYCALNDDDTTLFCSIQESNAILVVDITRGSDKENTVTNIFPLGYKDWEKYGIDTSNKLLEIDLVTRKNLWGLYQPDTIVYKTINSTGYLFLANEGDGKANWEMRVKDLDASQVDPEAFPDFDVTKTEDKLGRLKINPFCGLKDGYNQSRSVLEQGPYIKLCSFGARSFSILNAKTGEQVFESGGEFGKLAEREANALDALKVPSAFNNNNKRNDPFARSDDKGVEPEAIEVFELEGKDGAKKYMAVVGLERQGGSVTYDVTDPANSKFVTYINNRDYNKSLGEDNNPKAMGDLGPEMIKFLPASQSPSARPLLLISNEVSGSLRILEVVSFVKGQVVDTQVEVEVDCTDSTAKDNANAAMLKALESNGRPLSSELDTAKFDVTESKCSSSTRRQLLQSGNVVTTFRVTMDDQAARDGIAAAMESKGTDLFEGSGYASEIVKISTDGTQTFPKIEPDPDGATSIAASPVLALSLALMVLLAAAA